MSELILTETKRALFKAGSYVIKKHPVGETSSWSVANWIDYIDQHGEWVQ